MKGARPATAPTVWLGATCFIIVCIILIAGLEPFNPFPRNDVHWLDNENGLLFGPNKGVVFSPSPLPSLNSSTATLELWLEPSSNEDTNTILCVYTPENPQQLMVRQYRSNLEVRHYTGNETYKTAALAGIGHTLYRHKPVFFTLTLGPYGATLYADGVLRAEGRRLGLSATDFAGEIVLGTSAVGLAPWPGKIRGLAVYNRELTPDEVARHYNLWIENSSSDVLNPKPAALYRFDEGTGAVAHNSGGFGPDLRIPPSFKLPHQPFLMLPWNRSDSGISLLSDIAVNIAGFIPFGFFFCAWFATIRRSHHPILSTIIVGAAISLAIESLQSYLPTRDSDLTDFLMNTAGATLGSILYRKTSATLSSRHSFLVR